MNEPTDIELLEAWRDGDQRAANLLFDRQFPALYRFFRTKVTSGIDDLVQETLVGCLKSIDGFEQRSSFRTFLFTIARRVLYRYFSARSKHAVVDFGVSSVRDLGASPSTVWARRRIQQTVLDALTRVPLHYQTVLELYYWEDLTTDEVAEVLEVPAATARTQLRRGRERVAQVMRELGQPAEDFAALLGELRDRAGHA